jgi:hypothetical protein
MLSSRWYWYSLMERVRILALDAGNMEMYDWATAKSKAVAKDMHFRFPKTRGGRGYG